MSARVTFIRSGGQTGGDQGGLFAGRDLGIPTGGTAPHGWRTETGPAPWLEDYDLVEHASPEYPPRTLDNVRDSEGTVLFGHADSPGSRLTRRLCTQYNRPFFHVPYPAAGATIEERQATGARYLESFRQWLADHGITDLNVAGNRESKNPGICAATRGFLTVALRYP